MGQNYVRTHHFLTLMTGLSEFLMVGALHISSIAPVSPSIGHLIALASLGTYTVFSIVHIHHSVIAVVKPCEQIECSD